MCASHRGAGAPAPLLRRLTCKSPYAAFRAVEWRTAQGLHASPLRVPGQHCAERKRGQFQSYSIGADPSRARDAGRRAASEFLVPVLDMVKPHGYRRSFEAVCP